MVAVGNLQPAPVKYNGDPGGHLPILPEIAERAPEPSHAILRNLHESGRVATCEGIDISLNAANEQEPGAHAIGGGGIVAHIEPRSGTASANRLSRPARIACSTM